MPNGNLPAIAPILIRIIIGNKIRCSPDAKRIRCPPFRPVDAWRRRKSDGHVSGKLLAPPNGSLSFLAPRASACMARQRGCMHREAGNWNRPPRAEDMHAACCRALPTWCDWPKDHVAFSTIWQLQSSVTNNEDNCALKDKRGFNCKQKSYGDLTVKRLNSLLHHNKILGK